MFKRFSDRARSAMPYANWFACSTGSEHITEDHVFTGIVIQDEGIALEFLQYIGISTDQVRKWYAITCKKGDYEEPKQRLPLSKSASNLIDHAIKFCQDNRHVGVGTEHLLVGWLSIQNEATDLFFNNTGLTLDVVQAKVLDFLAGQRDKSPSLLRRLLRRLGPE